MRRPLLGIGILALLAACKDDVPPPPPANAASATAATTSAKSRPASAIQAEIALLERELAKLEKQAPRTFDRNAAVKLNQQMDAVRKRIAAAKQELAAATP